MKDIAETTKQLKKLRDIQGSDGTIDQGEYMVGLYNGIELAIAVLEGRDPEYKDCYKQSGELSTMTELDLVMNVAIEDNVSVGLLIEMPGFNKPELITNPYGNLEKKLEYYKQTYDKNLEHKHAKGIKIVGYTF